MSNDRDPYSRHYWKLVDDEKFVGIYDDDHHYATWSRLLMVADQAWPASAHLPASARRSSVAKLAEVGLIDILPGGRFRMRGTQAERERRSKHAKDAADARWTAERNARSNAGASPASMPSRAEQSKAETSTAPARPNGAAHGAESVGAVLAAQPFAQLVAPPPGYVAPIRPVPKPSARKKR